MPDLSQASSAPFVWGAGGAQMTPERIAAERKVAEAMMTKGMDFSPIQSWSQGASRVAQALMGAYDDRRAGQAENANAAADKAMVSGWFGGGTPAAAPTSPTAAPASIPAPTVLGAGGSPAAPDAQGVYGADAVMMPPETAVAAAPGSSVPRGIRNNNPLNIEAGSFTQGQPGFAGSDGRFAKFEQPQQGIDAAGKLLDTYQNKYGLNTVRGIVNRWAPSAEAGNNTGGYVASVAGRLGIDPDKPLRPDQRQALIQAMGQFENGRPIGGATAVAGADPAALPPNATPTQGTVPPGVPTPAVPTASPGVQGVASSLQGVNPGIISAMQSPYTSDATKKIAGLILQHQMQSDAVTHVDLGGQIGIMDKRGNIIRTVQKTEPTKAPTIVEGEVDPATGYPTKLLLRGDGKYERISLPTATPGAPAAAAPAVPPPPPGARAKEWYEMKSKDTAEAAIALPETIAKAQRSLDLIDMIEKHPGRETGTGLSSIIDPRNYIPGTHAKDFQVRQRQLQGQAFLEAFQGLKGGGAITDIEGKKATEAMASLDTSQSDETYVRSLKELREIITNGMNRAKAKADASFKPPAGNKTASGVTWSVE